VGVRNQCHYLPRKSKEYSVNSRELSRILMPLTKKWKTIWLCTNRSRSRHSNAITKKKIKCKWRRVIIVCLTQIMLARQHSLMTWVRWSTV
jgi:hypothetical protein